MSMSTSNIIIAQRTNKKAVIALSSLIHALFELETFAIARLVPKTNKPPVLVLLAPSIEVNYECLLDVQIPFAEDVRPYKFPPLDHVVTVSGKILKEHRNLPNDSLMSAMSDYVDALDLSSLGTDEEGLNSHPAMGFPKLTIDRNPSEYMAMSDTFSPLFHRVEQVVRWRAVHPGEPIPPPYEILTKCSKPPGELVHRAKRQLDRLVAAADIKKGSWIDGKVPG